MGFSKNTIPPWGHMARNLRRDREGRPVLPRVVYRRPRIGDVHPLAPRVIRGYIRSLPQAYLGGLRSIELRPRVNAVGCPYGLYDRREKRIVLYSVPPRVWRFAPEIWPNHVGLLGDGVNLVSDGTEGEEIVIEWLDPTRVEMALVDTLFHELGHHYVNQYRVSHGQPGTRARHEALADLHGSKLWKHLIRRLPKARDA